MNAARTLIDRIFEADEAPKGNDTATVKIELSGSPKQIQKALKQLAREKPAGVKVKGPGGEPVKADGPVKLDDKSKKDGGKPKDDEDDDDADDKGGKDKKPFGGKQAAPFGKKE